MSLQTLYLVEPGTVVRLENGGLRLERRDGTHTRAPLPRLGRVVAWGGVQVTTTALRALLRAGVDVAFVTRSGRFEGALRPPVSGSVVNLVAQLRCHADPARSLALARAVVRDKCASQVQAAQSAGRRRPGAVDGVAADIEAVAAGVEDAADVETLRGIEGAASRRWYEGFGALLKAPWRFDGRNRRPPRDPVNALLSLGYVLLTNEIRSDAEARGLDPRVGFLHELRAGRASLALDLVEPWRAPVVDRLVLTFLNRQSVSASDFRQEGEGVYLERPALTRFVEAYEARLGPRDEDSGSLRRRIAAWLDGFEARLRGEEVSCA